MKILVCISNVPDTTTKIVFSGDKSALDKNGVQFVINPYDEFSLTRALELAESNSGSVTVIHVGEAESEPTIRKALALGADGAVRINAKATSGMFVAKEISNYAKENNFDLILTGGESIDFNGNMVCPMIAEYLGLPSISNCKKLDIADGKATMVREIVGGKETCEAKLPLVVSAIEGISEPRIPNMRGIMAARTKPLEVIEAGQFDETVQYKEFATPPGRGEVTLIAADNVGELIEKLHNEAKVI